MTKEVFVKNFSDFIRDNVPYFADIKNLIYVQESDGEEYLYCNYESFSQKRIRISGDSEYGILMDFFNCIEHADWIIPVNNEIYNK